MGPSSEPVETDSSAQMHRLIIVTVCICGEAPFRMLQLSLLVSPSNTAYGHLTVKNLLFIFYLIFFVVDNFEWLLK